VSCVRARGGLSAFVHFPFQVPDFKAVEAVGCGRSRESRAARCDRLFIRDVFGKNCGPPSRAKPRSSVLHLRPLCVLLGSPHYYVAVAPRRMCAGSSKAQRLLARPGPLPSSRTPRPPNRLLTPRPLVGFGWWRGLRERDWLWADAGSSFASAAARHQGASR
jgi:hypothetical protein